MSPSRHLVVGPVPDPSDQDILPLRFAALSGKKEKGKADDALPFR
jgi:hypothetical protein